jgi:hypothetical protein
MCATAQHSPIPTSGRVVEVFELQRTRYQKLKEVLCTSCQVAPAVERLFFNFCVDLHNAPMVKRSVESLLSVQGATGCAQFSEMESTGAPCFGSTCTWKSDTWGVVGMGTGMVAVDDV